MADKKSSMDMDENLASALSYVLMWLTGIIFYFMEKENKTVRFHAMQSILLFIPLQIIGYIFTGILGVTWTTTTYYGYGYGVPTLSPFYYVGMAIWGISFILWLILMITAYQGKKIKIPVIGDIAEKQAEK